MPTLSNKINFHPVKNYRKSERSKIYNTQRWKNLRYNYLINHPLCQICFARGILKPAEEVHHSDSFANYTGAKRIEVAFNKDNLVSVCKQCHRWLHRNGTTHGIDIQKEAQLLQEYEKAHKGI